MEKTSWQKNELHAKGQINILGVISPEQDRSENEFHHSDKDAANTEPKKKILKKRSNSATKRNHSKSRPFKRNFNDVEKETRSDETPPKKQRKAAIKAIQKNKDILKHKETEEDAETTNENFNINHSNNEIEEVYSTPSTVPAKKRRFKSVFLTDTETGSSNVSWIGGRKSRLFESPQKIYSKRKKSKQTPKSTRQKKRNSKPTAESCKREENSNFHSFERKSKSGLSDLENYELIIETSTGHKKPSHLSNKPITFEKVSKAINDAMENSVESQNICNQFDKDANYANFELKIPDYTPEFYEEELQGNETLVKDNLVTAERNLSNISGEDFESNVVDESNLNRMKAKSSSLKNIQPCSSKFLLGKKESLTNSELDRKTASNDLLYSFGQKRKSANLSTSEEKVKRNRKDEGQTFDGFSLNDETFEKTVESHDHFSCSSPKIGILTEQSLSSLENNEATAKENHVLRYLEELSGESNSPNHFEHSENIGQTFSLHSWKTSQSNKSSKSDNLLNHSMSEKCLSGKVENSELSFPENYIDVKEKKHLTSFGVSNNKKSKASSESSLKKFSVIDDHESSCLQEELLEKGMKEDNSQGALKIKTKKPSMKLSIFHVLAVEMDNMIHILLKTLKKRFYEYNIKITASREKILAAANALVSEENGWGQHDLRNMATANKMNRINAEKSLKQILLVGQEYFKAEEMHNQRMKRLHQKALKKYSARVKLAGTYAVGALEDRAASKTESLLKSVLKKLEHL